MNTFDTFAKIMDDATAKAMRTWWTQHVAGNLAPTMIAAGDGAPPHLNIEAILGAVAAWETIYAQQVGPIASALLATRVAEALSDAGINPATVTQATTVDAKKGLEGLKAALSIIKEAGLSTTNVEYIVTTPGWANYVDAFAAARRNLVVGMPETVYRDLVTQLAAATRDGLDPWERSKITRSFLSWENEGGYEAWMTRAHRISRTETNGIINSADLHAWQIEASETGDDMEKVWVSTTDPRTRDEHFAADGQRVPLDGKFNIGGYPADAPGDSSLPAHLSINCRCAMLRVRKGEAVPDDTDRQTERERSDGTTRNPQDEVRSRANRGVTRDGDNDPQQPLIASIEGHTMTRKQWSGILAPVGKATGDGRIFDEDAEITFREFPLPLMFQRATGEGHDAAVIVGKISDATIDESGVHATGEFFDNDEAAEAVELVSEGVLRPSVDLTDMVIEYELLDKEGNPVDLDDDDIDFEEIDSELMHVRSATIMAATLVSKPAFAEAKIIIGEEVDPEDEEEEDEIEALLAAAGLASHTVPWELFTDPELEGPTALEVDEDGRVFGHLALWGTEHIGMPGSGITPPRSETGYSMFHTSSVATEEGPLAVGRLTVGTGHADARANVRATASHYDNTGTAWALVRAGEDQFGIWVAGIVEPSASEAQVRSGLSAPLSGDWRNVGGNLELVAALSVNTPGFPVPRSYSATSGRELSLVASGVVRRSSKSDQLATAVAEGLRRHDKWRAELAQAEARDAKARQLAASMLANTIGGC